MYKLRIGDCWSDEGLSLGEVLDMLSVKYTKGPLNRGGWGFGCPYEVSYERAQAALVYGAVLTLFGVDPDGDESCSGICSRQEWHQLKDLAGVPGPRSAEWEEPETNPYFSPAQTL